MHQRNAVPNPATMLPNFISLFHASGPLNIGRSSALSFTETFYVMRKTGKLNQHCEGNFMEGEAPIWNQGFVENQWANLTRQWTPDNPSPGEAKERRLQILVKPGLHCSQSKTVSQQRKDRASLVAYWRHPLQGSAAPGLGSEHEVCSPFLSRTVIPTIPSWRMSSFRGSEASSNRWTSRIPWTTRTSIYVYFYVKRKALSLLNICRSDRHQQLI